MIVCTSMGFSSFVPDWFTGSVRPVRGVAIHGLFLPCEDSLCHRWQFVKYQIINFKVFNCHFLLLQNEASGSNVLHKGE